MKFKRLFKRYCKGVFLFFVLSALLTACTLPVNKEKTPSFETEEGIKGIIEKLENKYSKEAGFNKVLLMYQEDVGDMISCTGANDINSYVLIESFYSNGYWQDTAEITLEIENGEPSDFMFKLDEVDVTKIPKLIEEAKKTLADDKNLEDTKVQSIGIIVPDEISDKLSDLIYLIILEPKNGGTRFTFNYTSDGAFIDYTY
ncbi:UNVERIFIED_CONTAM: hypothetical protein Cloal_2836 [Acetivibrio alkalicellulosi]